MRAFLKTVWVSLFLLVGGHSLHADNSPLYINDLTPISFVKKEQIKHKKIEQGSVLIEVEGFDLDEEFHQNNDASNATIGLIPVGSSFLDDWYLTLSHTFIVKNTAKQFDSLIPNCGYSCPIYLRIGVFRI